MMLKKIVRILLIASIFISFYLFLKATDINQSFRLVKQLGINAIWIFLCTLAAYLFGAIGWKYCIDAEEKPSFVKLLMVRHVGNIISIFNPTGPISGEILNATMLIREGVKEKVAYKSVLLSRIMMILSQLTILLIVFVWFLLFLSDKFSEIHTSVFYIGFVFFIIVIAILLYLILKNGVEVKQNQAANNCQKFFHRAKEMQFALSEYVRRRPKKAVAAFFAYALHWFLASLELYFIFSFIGFDVKIWDGLFMDTIIIVSKSAFWFIPGQLGAEELINKFVLFLVGVNSLNIWLSVSILRRARLMFWSVIAGIFFAVLNKREKYRHTNNASKVDIKRLFAERYPGLKIPGFVMRLIEKITAIDKINKLFAATSGKKNIEFANACMQYLNVSCNVVGEENLPVDATKLIFAGNHPQGGIEAICIASALGKKYGSNIKFYANELLCSLEPLTELFVPIYRRKNQIKRNLQVISDFYKTDNHLVLFPAGITSSKIKGEIIDHEWRKSFITEAIKYRRDVVPLFFQARNSELFYFMENVRRFIRSRINFDVLLLGHEFFKQRGKTFTLYIGKPVPWETFDKTKTPKEWANTIKEIALGLADTSLHKFVHPFNQLSISSPE